VRARTPLTLRIVESAPDGEPGAAEPLACAECGGKPRPDENADDEWRAYSDGVGELHVFCPECAESEFGEP
jgi:hypothetical protein